ncbi:glycosyltransferase [Streptomyces sp. 5-10]|uniref:glycosyltransferase n=1 Tax=Streptomyces sp. 5-10 TaxID=878925 RepID=UPI00168BB117|nr:glycosyltransferase [Streptomyces sp. 5-10]MBD3004877.1 class I SAM-dependent methyltransferase [Streptomyces sp. 5-10]
MNDHIYVSIPAGPGSGKTIRRAVDAVLAQTHRNLTLVVVNDGDPRASETLWPKLADIRDTRLVRYNLPDNRGRYHADAVVLSAVHAIAPDSFFAMHDADDRARPTWLATQLATLKRHKSEAVFCTHAVHGLHTRLARMERPKEYTGRFTFYAHMAGLWRTRFIHALGGPRPDFRVGYDTMLTGSAMATGKVRLYRGVLYDRHLQVTSLTKSHSTRIGSPMRKQAKDWMESRWPSVTRAARTSPEAVGKILTKGIPDYVATEVSAQSEALRRLLTDPSPNKTRTFTVPSPRTPVPDWAAVLKETSLWGAWALNLETGKAIVRELEARRPRRILEAGSGTSTVLFSQYADRYGAEVISLESSQEFRGRTRKLLDERGTGSRVDIRYAPLRRSADGPWYDTDIPEGVDLAIVDGPRAKDGGRLAALYYLMPKLNPGAIIILDDTDRKKEQADLREWNRRYGLDFDFIPGSNSTASYAVTPDVDARNTGGAKVVITLLTGRRPGHLDHTLNRLQACAPGLLSRAHVIALHNGGDAETARVLDKYNKVIDASWTSSVLYGIGEATSMLAQQAAASGRKYWLHLEDDWALIPTTSDWLAQAQQILHTRPDVHQVRLRHTCEKTLSKHMVTGRALNWYDYSTFHLCRDTHYTLNPSLVRVKDIGKIWPADGEKAAQRRAHVNRLRGAARLTPGVFVHTGEDDSLRAETRCKV